MGQLIVLLTMETTAAIIALIGALTVYSVVVVLLSTSSIEEDKTEAKKKVYKLRGRYFFGLIIVIVVLLFITLGMLPYPKFQKKPDEIVTVVGKQWAWLMVPGVSDQKPEDFTGESEITVPVNKLIRFDVTSADVNHDFAIYDDKGVLLKQVQAMPDYQNDLEYKFTQKGDYEIVCLEYCGLGHPYMVGTIHVK